MFNLKQKSNFFIGLAIFYIIFIVIGFVWLKWQSWSAKSLAQANKTATTSIELPKQADPLITKVPKFEDTITQPIWQSTDPHLGASNTPVTIVIYTDYECQYCGSLEEISQKMVKKFKGKVSLMHKDFPDPNQCSASYQAAVAARCAQEQNQFWSFSQALYQKDVLATSTFLQIAKNLGLDLNQFKACLKSQRLKNLIEDNIFEANALGISGVPYLFINNKEFMGQMSEKELETTIKTLLK